MIDRLGSDVSDFTEGQRIMGDFVMTRRGFAEYACVPAREAIVVPDGLSDEVATCLPQAGGIAENSGSGLSLPHRRFRRISYLAMQDLTPVSRGGLAAWRCIVASPSSCVSNQRSLSSCSRP